MAPSLGDADLAALGLEHATGDVAGEIRAQPGDQRGHVGRVHGVEAGIGRGGHHLGKGLLGHAGAGRRGERVGGDAVATQFGRLHQREGGDSGLGGRVGGLGDRPHQPGTRRGVDDTGRPLVALLGLGPPVVDRVAGWGEMAAQVHVHDRIPLVGLSGHEHPVAHDAGVVHQGVEATEGVDGGGDQRLGSVPVGDIVGARHRSPTAGDDLVDHLLGGCGAGIGPVLGHPDVVDDHRCALTSELQRVGAAQPSARTGDDHHSSFADTRHGGTLSIDRPDDPSD